jgi:DNA-binding MarR family transcriptional regulator
MTAMGEATASQVESDSPDITTARRYKQEYPWADQASIEIMLCALRLNSARTTAMNRFFESVGSVRSAGRYTLLRILFFAEEGRLTQIEIVNAMQVTSPNVTYLIDALEKEGLVVRTPHPTDRRVTYVELTEDGRATCAKLIPAMVDFMGTATRGFTEEEKQTFYSLLDRYRQNHEDYAAEE